MFRTARRWRLFALTATAALAFAACSGTSAPSPSGAASAPPAGSEQPSSAAPFDAMTYPEGEVTCASGDTPGSYNGKEYGGEFKSIKAIDARTVEFTLCYPDVAFLSKVAFSSFQIDDSAYLEEAGADGSIVEKPNGAGPYELTEWVRGDHITLTARDDYWGEAPKTKTVIFRWSAEAAQRLVELQSGNVDGIDNVGPDDFEAIQGDSSLKLYPREALNVFYVGFNNKFAPFDNEKVRQAVAMGIDRQRIVDNFYPEGSDVASHFTPCSIVGGCEGPEWYEFDPTAAKALLAEAGFPNGFETNLHYRDVVRGYLPDPNVVAQDIQAQLKANLNITVNIDVQESGTFIDNADAGNLDGIHLLGWGADYPDQTNFLDYHFGAGASAQFGEKFPDIVAALQEGASNPDENARKAAYGTANELIKQHVPMVPVAHGGSATAFKADVEGAHSSPLSNENFSVMSAAGRDQLVWMQNGEPAGLYCADESDGEALRVCEQIGMSLYAYEVAGTAAEPALAESCEPNDDLTVWTCTLREGVTFADGSALDANDVVMSYAVQWDAEHALHKGRDGSFTYFSALFGFLNPPPAE